MKKPCVVTARVDDRKLVLQYDSGQQDRDRRFAFGASQLVTVSAAAISAAKATSGNPEIRAPVARQAR